MSTAKLKVLHGPRPGAVFELDAQRRYVVGRSVDATIRIDAPGLSRQHFEVSWSGHEWRVCDLQSRNGIAVNGRLVAEARLRSGDTIAAADVQFVFEADAPRRRIIEEVVDDQPAAPERARAEEPTLLVPLAVYDHVTPTLTPKPAAISPGTLMSSLMHACEGDPNGRVYAVIDGAQAFELAFTARLMGNRLYTLFKGPLAVDLAHVGPCLVELQKPEPFLEKWIDAIGKHAGVLLQTHATLPALYAHLRHLFVATDEDQREYFFRFYDPRVLRVFLPTCTATELGDFFGPIVQWFSENVRGDGYLRFTVDRGMLRQGEVVAAV